MTALVSGALAAVGAATAAAHPAHSRPTPAAHPAPRAAARALPRPRARVVPDSQRRTVPDSRARSVQQDRASASVARAIPPVEHSNPYLEIPPPSEVTASRAYHYANMSDTEVLAELARRNIGWVHATPPLPGVRTPIKLTGPLHGVTIHGTLPPEQAAQTSYDILDARLALALDDFCAILRHHDVVEIVHFTMYRPSGEPEADPNAPQFRHPGGLAIDVGGMKKRDGQWLAVGPHWSAAIGAKTCGQGGRTLVNPRGREILSIVCEASDQRIFTYMLSPHFNAAHADHLHLEIKPGVKWFLVN